MRTRTQGVTLVELLVAISLLSLLSVGMLMALHVGLNATGKANDKLIANRRSVSVQRILRSEIEGLIPVSASCAPAAGIAPIRVGFFEGQPESMRFVSGYSLNEAARGLPQILEFQVIPGADGRGVRLIVNESVYTGPDQAGADCIGIVPDAEGGPRYPHFRRIEAGPGSFVLADKLAYCRFSYRRKRPPPVFEEWSNVWPYQEWPSAVKVDMAPLEPDPSKVPLVGVTAPIRIDRQQNAFYSDMP
jgi:prepilin-type N-terminal cleavage/methylation domain-containing protein